MFPISEAFNLALNIWHWMQNTYILNVAEISITFSELLLIIVFYSVIRFTVQVVLFGELI